jgi:mRNA interferase RelE/StbE
VAAYKVVIAASASKELEQIAKRDRERIGVRVRSLASNPRPPGCEKLSGQDKYRIRQGDYRILYAVDDSNSIVDVVKIGHRREVYR